ncbi:hypothetical protein [Microbacterium sp.]|uniref:hypothetical protein n=1 Tax=Microbacterium sp. TaxID=51671 RepID=UPI0033400A0F
MAGTTPSTTMSQAGQALQASGRVGPPSAPTSGSGLLGICKVTAMVVRLLIRGPVPAYGGLG